MSSSESSLFSFPPEETVPPNTTPFQPPPDSRSFALTPDQLTAKQAQWKAKGFSDSAIEELTALLRERQAIADHLRTFVAKGDDYFKNNPKEKEALDLAVTKAKADDALIMARRQQLYDALAEEKRLEAERLAQEQAPTPDTTPFPYATPEQLRMAQEVMTTDYLGPEAIKTTWDVTLKPEQIPPIPFSREVLERAKQLNQFLILRIDHTADGKPLTMQTMQSLMQPQFETQQKGKVLNNTALCKNEDFFTTDTPQPHWVLVSKNTIPNSTNKTYLQQTQTLVTYLTTQVFTNQPIPSPYKEAIEEFEREKASIQAIPDADWKLVTERLAQLQITQLTCALPVEVLYDLLTMFQATGVRLIPNKWIYTRRRSAGGSLVGVGYFDEAGASVFDWGPGDAYDNLGGSLSRSH